MSTPNGFSKNQLSNIYFKTILAPLLASKVFSKHEAGAFDADPKMLAKVKLAIEAPPKMKIPWPETVSQW